MRSGAQEEVAGVVAVLLGGLDEGVEQGGDLGAAFGFAAVV